jgi:DNA replication protein DnaC
MTGPWLRCTNRSVATSGDPTFADGILDRLVHNAHRIEMRGESMRKIKAAKPER